MVLARRGPIPLASDRASMDVRRRRRDVRTQPTFTTTTRGQGRRKFLVVDDVLVSGSRLSARNRELREREEPPASVNFIVGVARPISEDDWKKLSIALTTRHPWDAKLAAVETFWLPNWQEKSCPWCREYDFLVSITRRLAESPAWLVERVASLTSRERGLEEDALWFLPGISTPSLGHGSVVGPEGMSATATLFAFASALQRLRHDAEGKRLNPHFPEFGVFDLKNVKNYSEALLRAVMLRAVLPQEWGTLQSGALRDELSAALSQGDHDSILAELVLAIARGSLDRSFSATVEPALRERYSAISPLLLDGLAYF
ncbi:MAG TPA: hypothetical protein VHH90_02675 [Polyangia bacterium]|nr:hypothetical protein [Polyangia bacterium]